MLTVNLPSIVHEVTEAFLCYEDALMKNDVDALIDKFWSNPHAVRFGATENLYGIKQIIEFRQNRVPPAKRILNNTQITTFGHDFAIASTEYTNAKGECGRQMQTWIRIDTGWRIAAAHISLLPHKNSA